MSLSVVLLSSNFQFLVLHHFRFLYFALSFNESIFHFCKCEIERSVLYAAARYSEILDRRLRPPTPPPSVACTSVPVSRLPMPKARKVTEFICDCFKCKGHRYVSSSTYYRHREYRNEESAARLRARSSARGGPAAPSESFASEQSTLPSRTRPTAHAKDPNSDLLNPSGHPAELDHSAPGHRFSATPEREQRAPTPEREQRAPTPEYEQRAPPTPEREQRAPTPKYEQRAPTPEYEQRAPSTHDNAAPDRGSLADKDSQDPPDDDPPNAIPPGQGGAHENGTHEGSDIPVEARLAELRTAQQFITALRHATLENSGLDFDAIERLRHPPCTPLHLAPGSDLRLSLDLFLGNASEDNYEDSRNAIMRRFPDCEIHTIQ
ncbi:hypothetical protein B0H21DRAFT_823263 [Amylocystis lapponica]|nr:hypothetical protein B0H21DRAFT_823263 [Amylocystis lapponica]